MTWIFILPKNNNFVVGIICLEDIITPLTDTIFNYSKIPSGNFFKLQVPFAVHTLKNKAYIQSPPQKSYGGQSSRKSNLEISQHIFKITLPQNGSWMCSNIFYFYCTSWGEEVGELFKQHF